MVAVVPNTVLFGLFINADTQDHSVLKLVGTSDRGNGNFVPGGNGWQPIELKLKDVEQNYWTEKYKRLNERLKTVPQPLADKIRDKTEKTLDPEFEQLKKRSFFMRLEKGSGTNPNKLTLCVHQRVGLDPKCVPKLASIDGGYALQQMFPERPLCEDIQPLCATPALESVEKHWTVAGSTRLFASETEAHEFVKKALLKP